MLSQCEALRPHSLPLYRSYYWAMIPPVLVLGFELIPASIYAWIAFAFLIVCGSWVIRWKTEQVWGRYSA